MASASSFKAAQAAPALAVWDEFGSSQGLHGRQSEAQGNSQQAAKQSSLPPTGSAAGQEWLTALARHCESAEGAKSKAELAELLQCGSRARSKVVLVNNRARLQIGKVFRQALAALPEAPAGMYEGAWMCGAIGKAAAGLPPRQSTRQACPASFDVPGPRPPPPAQPSLQLGPPDGRPARHGQPAARAAVPVPV